MRGSPRQAWLLLISRSQEKHMKKTIISVPSGVQYLSDVEEIRTIYNNDLPPNAIIDKQLTGVGGTTLALRNKENYVIAVQTIKLVKGKSEAEEGVFGFYGGTTDSELREYLNSNEARKIITTYDSVPRVASVLGSKVSDFRLLVDEYHRMIAYMDNFKVSVCLALLENTYKFKSVSYLTATPTDLEWLPEPLKKLEYIKFDWKNKTYPDLKHCYVKDNINEKVLSLILDKLNNTEEELYIFYNSCKAVVSVIKSLLKCKPELSLKDINILFAETPKNTRYFKKYLSKCFQYGEIPDGSNNKRLNFISSMCYEGTDFFPNNDTSGRKTPTTLIVSNPNSITMRLDIQTDLTQIAGRFRRHKVLGRFVPNPIIYIWNTQKVDYIKDKQEYLNDLLKSKRESEEALEFSKTNNEIKKLIEDKAKTNTHKFFISVDNSVIIHPYGVETGMNTYETFHNVSCVIGNTDEEGNLIDDSKVVVKLTELSPSLSTYEIPGLSTTFVKSLGRKPSVTRMLREYKDIQHRISQCTLSENAEGLEEAQSSLEVFLQTNPEFDEWLSAGVTVANINTVGKSRERINRLAETKRMLASHSDAIIYDLDLKIGGVYSVKHLKEVIQKYYDTAGILKTAKATDITQWFEVSKTSFMKDGKKLNALKIVAKLGFKGGASPHCGELSL